MSGPQPAAARRLWRAAAGGDRGSSVVTTVVIAPLLMTVILLVIQYALIFHARQVAESAAQDGLRAAQVNHGGSAAARQAAARFAANDSTLHHPTPTVDNSGGELRVTVHGAAQSIIPLLPTPTVTGIATGPAEAPLPPAGR